MDPSLDAAGEELSTSSEWIDISVPLTSGMVHWPTDPPVLIERHSDIAWGDVVTVSHLSMTAHSGTHIDAPHHFISEGYGIDEIPIQKMLGPARVVQIHHPHMIDAPELESMSYDSCSRVLFRTSNSDMQWHRADFRSDYVHVTAEAARYLVDQHIDLVGVDYLSVGAFDDGVDVHKILLEAGICVLEGLEMSSVVPGDYELICLPLRIAGADGAPARALIRPLRV